MIPLLTLGVLAGCGSHSGAAGANPANDAFISKLSGMPASQRAAYAKEHMDEVMKAAQSGAPPR